MKIRIICETLGNYIGDVVTVEEVTASGALHYFDNYDRDSFFFKNEEGLFFVYEDEEDD